MSLHLNRILPKVTDKISLAALRDFGRVFVITIYMRQCHEASIIYRQHQCSFSYSSVTHIQLMLRIKVIAKTY